MDKFKKYIDLFYGIAPPIEDWPMRNLHVTMALYRNRLVAAAFNCKKTHPINLVNKKINGYGENVSEKSYTCSEYNCCRMVKRKTNIDFSDIIFLNMRMTRNKELAYASCCSGCSNLIKFISPKALYYTNDQGNFELYSV